MTGADQPAPPADARAELTQRLTEWDARIIDGANHASAKAFNLGCVVGLLPAALIVLLTFLLTRFSWVGALVMAALMVMALILFANVAAGFAHRNTIKRIAATEIEPELERALSELRLDRSDLIEVAQAALPDGSPLRGYLDLAEPTGAAAEGSD